MDMNAIMQRIQEIISSGVLDETTIAELGNLWTLQQAAQGQQQVDLGQRDYDTQNRELDYKNDYVAFQTQELGLRGQELEQAMREFEFKSGDYFDFYKENEIAKLQASTQQSQDDVFQSANHLQQTRMNTDIASMNRDMARFQYSQAMGIAPPSMGQTNHQAPKVLQQFNKGY